MNYSILLSEMLEGTLNSLALFGLTLLFSLPLGLILCVGRRSRFKIINIPVKFYLLLLRGTPLMLQLMFVFYVVNPLLPFRIDRFPAAVVAFVLNYAAYFAEIYRGGMESIPVGQYEAANVLGFSKKQTFFKIILPQVIKRILPPMGNEFITLVKDTSLAKVISVVELMKVTSDWANSAANFVPFIIAAIFYLVMNGIVSKCFSIAEKKLSYYR